MLGQAAAWPYFVLTSHTDIRVWRWQQLAWELKSSLHLFPGTSETTLDRTDGHFQSICCFFVTKILDIDQYQNQLMLRGDHFETTLNCPCEFQRFQVSLRVCGKISHPIRRLDLVFILFIWIQRLGARTTMTTQFIIANIRYDTGQPSTERSLSIRWYLLVQRSLIGKCILSVWLSLAWLKI